MFSVIQLTVTIGVLSLCDVSCSAEVSSKSTDDFVVVGNNEVNDGGGCQFLLESFARVSANFTFCAIRNARPIELCQQCVQEYIMSVEVHDDILKLEDEAGELCKEKLLNLDRLQVVEGGFNYIKGLWNRASCDSCYDLGADGKPSKLNSRVREILNLNNITQTCITEHRNDTTMKDPNVCTECKQYYLNLNAKYNHLKDKATFCMDIIDLINTTRYEWSVKIGCCLDRQGPELTFIISTGIISLLPCIFYLIACTFTGKKELKVAVKKGFSIPYPDAVNTQESIVTATEESAGEPVAGCSKSVAEKVD